MGSPLDVSIVVSSAASPPTKTQLRGAYAAFIPLWASGRMRASEGRAARESDMADKTLTEAQTKALDEADSIFDRALKEATEKIRIVRGDTNNESFTHCLRCDCEFYMMPQSGSTCARFGCRHPFFSHDVF